MAKPTLEPAPPYENLHLVARDYLDRLRQTLDALQKPNDPALRWRDVHAMAKSTPAWLKRAICSTNSTQPLNETRSHRLCKQD